MLLAPKVHEFGLNFDTHYVKIKLMIFNMFTFFFKLFYKLNKYLWSNNLVVMQ